MFERLLELLIQLWERVCPLEIVNVYQRGAVLRFGKFHRVMEPGAPRWKWPIAEHVITVETCITTVRLPPQTLTTKDDVSVVVAAILKYQIKDLEPYVTEIWDQHDVLADVTMGAIRMAVNQLTYHELITTPPEEKVIKLAREEVNQYGFKLHRITFTDIGRVRSLRLITRTPRKIDN